MPLVIVHSLPPTDPHAIPQMLAEIRDSGARALRCSVDNVWVMFHAVPAGHYVQGESASSAPGPESHPPVVEAKLQAGRTREELDAFIAAVATAVGHGLSVPAENVWIHYDEMHPQEVWFRGRWSARA